MWVILEADYHNISEGPNVMLFIVYKLQQKKKKKKKRERLMKQTEQNLGFLSGGDKMANWPKNPLEASSSLFYPDS